MRILASGAAGYVGSTVVRRLLAGGHEAWAYDNLSKGHRQSVPADRLIVGDMSDGDRLVEALRQHRIEAVMHFAGLIAVGESVAKPSEYYRNNIAGSLVLLDAMRQAGVGKILFSSTAAVYAPIQAGALQENSPKAPASPYAFSKYAVEQFIADYAAAYGFGYVLLRYFNACGASPDGRFGEDHEPETHLIPLVLQVALGTRPSIKIFGDDYDTPDGTCIRDYIHVDDLAEAHILAVEHLQPGGGDTYNIGTGNGNSVLEVIRAAEQVVGRPIAAQRVARRAGDVARLVAGSEKIARQFGWRPKYADLASVIETAWAWHSSHPNGYGD